MKAIPEKECLQCGKIFQKKPTTSSKRWLSVSSFCSKRCTQLSHKGVKLLHLKEYQFTKGFTPANKGKKNPASSIRMKQDNPMKRQENRLKSSASHKGKQHSVETRRKMSQAQKRIVQSGRHLFYKHGKSSTNKMARNNVEYKIWRSAVFQRDAWLCQTCRLRENNKLHAHHIKSWSTYPELRFVVNNGVTLCEDCHKLTDSYPQNLCPQRKNLNWTIFRKLLKPT